MGEGYRLGRSIAGAVLNSSMWQVTSDVLPDSLRYLLVLQQAVFKETGVV